MNIQGLETKPQYNSFFWESLSEMVELCLVCGKKFTGGAKRELVMTKFITTRVKSVTVAWRRDSTRASHQTTPDMNPGTP